VILSKTKTVAIALAAFMAFAAAQDKKKEWKSQAEFDLVTALNKNPDAKARLGQLDQWKKDFPETDYLDIRLKAYMVTYQQLNQPHDAIAAAKEVLKLDPNDNLALTTILSVAQAEKPPTPEDITAADEAGHYILAHLDDVYAPAKKPEGQTAAQWDQVKTQIKAYIPGVVFVWVATNRGEDAVIKALQADPSLVALNTWLGQQLVSQAKAHPERYPLALFHYARAAAYDGPGSDTQANRDKYKAFLDKAYKTYHGSARRG
jgi:tetratricopeptide (TPR) repeat protein